MSVKDSETNDNKEYFLRRIEQIRMSDIERLNAKARFERAEAVAAAIAAAAQATSRLFAALAARLRHAPRRPASSAG
jgi:hypothetical protein